MTKDMIFLISLFILMLMELTTNLFCEKSPQKKTTNRLL